MTYYDTLGLNPMASADDIRASYRQLAKKLHPDKNESAGTFKAVSEAFFILNDPEKRAQYDASLQSGGGGTEPSHFDEQLARTLYHEHCDDIDSRGGSRCGSRGGARGTDRRGARSVDRGRGRHVSNSPLKTRAQAERKSQFGGIIYEDKGDSGSVDDDSSVYSDAFFAGTHKLSKKQQGAVKKRTKIHFQQTNPIPSVTARSPTEFGRSMNGTANSVEDFLDGGGSVCGSLGSTRGGTRTRLGQGTLPMGGIMGGGTVGGLGGTAGLGYGPSMFMTKAPSFNASLADVASSNLRCGTGFEDIPPPSFSHVKLTATGQRVEFTSPGRMGSTGEVGSGPASPIATLGATGRGGSLNSFGFTGVGSAQSLDGSGRRAVSPPMLALSPNKVIQMRTSDGNQYCKMSFRNEGAKPLGSSQGRRGSPQQQGREGMGSRGSPIMATTMLNNPNGTRSTRPHTGDAAMYHTRPGSVPTAAQGMAVMGSAAASLLSKGPTSPLMVVARSVSTGSSVGQDGKKHSVRHTTIHYADGSSEITVEKIN